LEIAHETPHATANENTPPLQQRNMIQWPITTPKHQLWTSSPKALPLQTSDQPWGHTHNNLNSSSIQVKHSQTLIEKLVLCYSQHLHFKDYFHYQLTTTWSSRKWLACQVAVSNHQNPKYQPNKQVFFRTSQSLISHYEWK